MQKLEFKVKVGEEEKNFVVRLPDGKLRKKAREEKARFFRLNALKEDCIFAHQIPDILKKKGLWSEQKEEEIQKVSRSIEELVRKLSKGKTESVPTKEVLKDIVLKEIKPLRNRQLELLGERSQLDSLSIESQAEQAEFNYLVANSTYYNEVEKDGPVYSSVDDYIERADEPYSEEAGKKLAELIGNSNPNWYAELPENKLLIKHGFMNAEGKYIDKDGNLVNSEGKRINTLGYLVNENGEQVDSYGNKIDDEGNVIEYTEFE